MYKIKISVILFCLLWCVLATAQSNLSALNTKAVEYAPSISSDGLYMVFQSNRNKGFRLYESTKNDSVWGEAQSIEPINGYAGSELAIIGSPYLSSDGNTLYYAAIFENTYGNVDLYYSLRRNDTWSKPEHFSELINSKLPETAPSVSSGGDTLFFIRKGTDPAAPACGKVFFSVKNNDRWSSAQALLSTPSSCYNRLQQTYAGGAYWAEQNNTQELLEVTGAQLKRDDVLTDFMNGIKSNSKTTWITPKEDELVYVYNGDLYSAPLAYNTHIKGTSFIGKVKDKEKGIPIERVELSIIDALHHESTTKVLGGSGEYKLYVPGGCQYQVIVTAEKYDTLIRTYEAGKGYWFRIQNEDILLSRRKRKMVFDVSDKDNGKNLKVKVKVTNKRTGEEIVLDENSQQDGRYTVHLREGDEYSVEVNNVEGYNFVKKELSVGDTANFSVPVSKIKRGTSLEIEDIYFDYNSYKLKPESFKELDKLVQWMKTNKHVMVRIEAHTDDIGSDEYNAILSDKRAKEIVLYLTKQGITSSRMQAKGLGKTKPRAEGETEEARALNRRVELHILNIQQ